MCHRVSCKSCGKPSWAGCGAHIEQALAGVPKPSRCCCREQRAKPAGSGQANGGQTNQGGSFFDKLFGR